MERVKTVSIFLKAFKDFSWISILIVLGDLFTSFFTFFLITKWANYFENIVFSIPSPEKLLAMPIEQVEAIFEGDPAKKIFISLLLLFIMLIITFSITRSALWLLSLNKRINFRALVKFSLILMSWYFIVLAPMVLLLFILKQDIITIFIAFMFPLFLHYSLSLHITLAEKQSFRQILIALKIGTKKIHIFLLVYLIFGITFFIINMLWGIVRYTRIDPFVYVALMSGIVLCYLRYFLLRKITGLPSKNHVLSK